MALGNQSVALQNMGRLEEAIEINEKNVRLCRQSGDRKLLATALINKAVILDERLGRIDEALPIAEEAFQLAVGHLNDPNLEQQISGIRDKIRQRSRYGDDRKLEVLHQKAITLQSEGKQEQAMESHQQCENLCRKLGDQKLLGVTLGAKAMILSDQGKTAEAASLYAEMEQVCRRSGDLDTLQVALCNQGLALKELGQLDKAMALHKEREQIARKLENADGIQASLCNQALIHKEWGQYDKALRLHKEEERICRKLDNPKDLVLCLGNQAEIHKERSRFEKALALIKEQEKILRQAVDPNAVVFNLREMPLRKSLVGVLVAQALLLANQMGYWEEALSPLEEAYRLAADIGMISYAKNIKKMLEQLRAQL